MVVLKKELLYPFFLECCNSQDNFWDSIFIDLAYGIPPRGTFINKGYLCCAYKDKEFSYKLERKNQDILRNDIYNLLNKKLGILSEDEKYKKRIEFEEYGKELNKKKTWNDIRRKNIKIFLLERYVIDLKKATGLNNKEAKELYSIITLCLSLKLITNKDINFNGNFITSINGIEIESGQIKINYDIYNLEGYEFV